MNFKKGILTSFLLITSLLSVFSQVVTTDPEFPTANDAVTIYFDATQGNQELKDYTGDIYAHTGLITDQSSGSGDWKYVIAGWDENIDKAKLTEVSTNLYKLEIQPSIKEFYIVDEGEEILQLAFVFRNSDGSLAGREADGGNIYADVYPPGLNVSLSSPTDDFIILPGEQINISASSNDADSMHLWIDDVLISKLAGTTIDYTHTENIAGSHKIIVQAKNTDETATDSVYYFARGNNTIAELPSGWIKGINYLADDSLGLVLFAPNKEFIFVIGDFADWKLNENYMMNVTPNDSIYWLSIGSLIAGKEYIFQYYIDGELKIADPYTEKTSDPNDKYISEETYPGLIEYPATKTRNIASVLQTDQNEYQWKNNDFIAPEKENLIIYELLVRDFVAKHDYKTLIDTLDYLDSLGVNAIELMPFNEFEGNESWGYNPSFYFAPDKYYGTKDKLKEFVDSCHGRGIAVIMDMVLNHSYSQSPLVQMYFDGEKPTSENPWYNIQSPNSTYSWGYDFNHESDYTKEFVDSVNRFWLEVYKIDGFRFDFTKGFTNTPGDGWSYDASRINILKRMAISIWESNPDAYVILEHLTDNSEEKVLAEFGMLLWGNINYNYTQASTGYDDSDIEWVSYKKRGWTVPHVVAYMESHDEERLMYKNLQYGNSSGDYNIKELSTALKRIELVANFFIPIPGPKMIWQFGELGYDISIDYDCRVCNKPIHWEYYSQEDRFRLFTIYKTLNELKQEYDVFSTSDFLITQDGKKKTINLYDDEMNVVIIGNFDLTTTYINTSFPTTGNWFELYSGDTLSVSHTEEMIGLEAGECRFYTDVKLKQPNLPTSVLGQIQSQKLNINVFPNPSSDIFFFEINKEINDGSVLYLYDIQGQLKFEKISYDQDIIELEATGLKNGIYFYKLIVNNNIYTGKILKN